MYYLLTGTRVFTGDIHEVFRQHLGSDPQRPSSRLGKPIPVDLEKLILRCLEKSRERRPANAGEVYDDLMRCTSTAPWEDEQASSWWERAPAEAGAEPGACGVTVSETRARHTLFQHRFVA